MAEVKKTFKQPIPVEDRNGWEKMLSTHRQQVNDLTSRITHLEAQINTQVYGLFGLTADEIRVVEDVILKCAELEVILFNNQQMTNLEKSIDLMDAPPQGRC